MIISCKFDKDKDIEQVIPDLEISIEMAMNTGVIKDTGTSTPYTKETDVNKVGNYIHDNIEAAMELRRIGASLSNMPTSTSFEGGQPQGE